MPRPQKHSGLPRRRPQRPPREPWIARQWDLLVAGLVIVVAGLVILGATFGTEGPRDLAGALIPGGGSSDGTGTGGDAAVAHDPGTRPVLDGVPAGTRFTGVGSTEVMRIEVPSVGINAHIIPIDFNQDGSLETPRDAVSVGWYTISAWPGEAGNVLLGGHLNWGGRIGVFDRLDELAAGDVIYLTTPDGVFQYHVERAELLPWNSPFTGLLNRGSDDSMLTLFTCSGTFDRSRGEYDHRLVIRARNLASTAAVR